MSQSIQETYSLLIIFIVNIFADDQQINQDLKESLELKKPHKFVLIHHSKSKFFEFILDHMLITSILGSVPVGIISNTLIYFYTKDFHTNIFIGVFFFHTIIFYILLHYIKQKEIRFHKERTVSQQIVNWLNKKHISVSLEYYRYPHINQETNNIEHFLINKTTNKNNNKEKEEFSQQISTLLYYFLPEDNFLEKFKITKKSIELHLINYLACDKQEKQQ